MRIPLPWLTIPVVVLVANNALAWARLGDYLTDTVGSAWWYGARCG